MIFTEKNVLALPGPGPEFGPCPVLVLVVMSRCLVQDPSKRTALVMTRSSYVKIRKSTLQSFIGYVFLKQLGLDSILASWDLKIRIPRRKLRI